MTFLFYDFIVGSTGINIVFRTIIEYGQLYTLNFLSV